FDRGAVNASLHRPQGALRHLRPKQARYQLRYTSKYEVFKFHETAACFGRWLSGHGRSLPKIGLPLAVPKNFGGIAP
ncbi:MAG: hypothetical protein ACI4IW_03260, partial [Oscillospiraceae bacterium]